LEAWKVEGVGGVRGACFFFWTACARRKRTGRYITDSSTLIIDIEERTEGERKLLQVLQ
jgi:hypothetical protein